MNIYKGTEGLSYTWQTEFLPSTECVHCKGNARIGFVGYERDEEPGNYISDLHENKKQSLWLHDACAVAVYFCEKCLEPTAKYNQA